MNIESDFEDCDNPDHWHALGAARLMAAAIDLMVIRGVLDERSVPVDARLRFNGLPVITDEEALTVVNQLRSS